VLGQVPPQRRRLSPNLTSVFFQSFQPFVPEASHLKAFVRYTSRPFRI
jgi:hypothetical protein